MTAAAFVAAVVTRAGPSAYALSTASTPHQGALPSAGPASSSAGGFARRPAGQRLWPPRGAAGGLLDKNASRYRWAAAVIEANAAGYQLAADRPVMAIGGFNGSDPARL